MSPSLRTVRPPLVLAAVAVLVALAALGYALSLNTASASNPTGTVEVDGTGTVTTRPDTLTVDFSVTVIAKSSRAALATDDSKTHALEASLIGAGVLARDLQTTNLSVGENFNSQGHRDGYSAENDVTATLHNLSKSGQVIGAAQASVGNDISINNTTYSLSNETKYANEARMDAMRNALNKARSLAAGGNESLGHIVKITESNQSTIPPEPVFNKLNAAAGTARSTPSVPLRPGVQTVTEQVDVVVALIP